MTNAQRVLVVDGQSETEQVLRAVLEPRGLEVEAVRRSRLSIATGDEACEGPNGSPHVVVFHQKEHAPDPSCDVPWRDAPTVFVGSTSIPARPVDGANRRYLAHPFHYGELIAAIDELLVERAA